MLDRRNVLISVAMGLLAGIWTSLIFVNVNLWKILDELKRQRTEKGD